MEAFVAAAGYAVFFGKASKEVSSLFELIAAVTAAASRLPDALDDKSSASRTSLELVGAVAIAGVAVTTAPTWNQDVYDE